MLPLLDLFGDSGTVAHSKMNAKISTRFSIERKMLNRGLIEAASALDVRCLQPRRSEVLEIGRVFLFVFLSRSRRGMSLRQYVNLAERTQ